MVITQNGRPSVVVLTPEDFEELTYRKLVKGKIDAGIASAQVRTYSAEEVRAHFEPRPRTAAGAR